MLISKSLVLVFTIYIFLSLVMEYEVLDVASTVINESSSTSINPSILINTTKVSNCIPQHITDNNDGNNSTALSLTESNKTNKANTNNETNNENTGICKILRVSDSISCSEYKGNQSEIPCESNDSDENNLKVDNFADNGHLLADTKYDQQYSFELTDPVGQDKKFRVTMDFDKHTQSENNDINSPRLEIVRENSEGIPDMSAAKNQEIIWYGNIHEYFKEPKDKFENETSIDLQFNTGRHGSNEPDEERGFGILFDVSGSSNPYLLEYRDEGKYVKYDFNTTKELAQDSFIFHQVDEKDNPIFNNNLTNKENVELKVRTFLTDKDTRMIETFVDNGSGKEIPYWTLSNLSKLKEQEGINDENGFMETINQGSGYVIARTDNIDTRPSSFKSFSFDL
ncbi:hypothetical protein NARC_200053 [Candidatus Nitrosocosmicus arcticus]|uniref:Uncharacterized protein n=2 Tax=Candidatus Nitrosocosmicus arcticus TaxID=2035267 RepID=A0A557SRD2_9ARCH|nr:hypothetical protein NARC_200053 [Candidatus Nitrosocosmicus arcticus]